ncbi:HAD family hydrolase [Desertivibrio insolitus]|uniref:HAD family hydrolase n=1 Tax=Herbiconiux sp. SYSU D00978 TaxID=2812562 RepID=UPI001A9658B8|nr:HAD family hydrolase [Herbiconiux sp. SYSU D00978]
MSDRWLIALDIDGTVLTEDGEITDAVLAEVARVRDAGHEVMLATGRSVAMTLPVLERLGLTSEFVVTANGAITLKRDADAPAGYRRENVETFDPTDALQKIARWLESAHFAVEDENGFYRYTGEFPEGSLGAAGERVEFEELFGHRATRLVVIAPETEEDEFIDTVERMGLHKVAYNIGWTNWLDIAPHGVTKAFALERVREALEIPRSQVVAIGDGRNDIEMLQWAAAEGGRGVAMGSAPPEVVEAGNEQTGSEYEDGVAQVLATL